MKKLLSVILCFALMLSFAVPAFATSVVEDVSEYPVLLVAGYSSSDLVMTDDDGNVSQIWGLDFNKVLEMVEEEYLKILLGGAKMTQGDYEYLGKFLGEAVLEVLEYMKCNPDGTSKYNVSTIVENTAEASKWSTISDEYRAEGAIMDEVFEYVSEDSVYLYNCDFRMGAMENAERMRILIEDICATTGYDKVNVLCISHGGQITGTYLSLYADDPMVNNCVMCMPAMGGAALAYDIAVQNVVFDENTLVKFLEHGFNNETDFHWLTAAQSLGFLDDLLAEAVPYICELLYTWSSIWDFIPNEYLDEVIDVVDADYYSEIIAKTKVFHEQIMANYGINLKTAQSNGAKISIITGCGIPSVTGLQQNSDAIIRTADTTGAVCAPYGQRFSDGYVTLKTSCTDATHNHLSPSMEIDASACWLPDNSWFVDGLYHGMENHDEYSQALMLKQLLSAEPLADVYADTNYPQFKTTTNNSSSVYAAFDNGAEGYLDSDDKYLLITNITTVSTIDIYDVTFNGTDIEVEDFMVKTVKSGNTIKLKIEGYIPEVSLVRGSVTISYLTYGSVTPIGTQTFDFTIMNGEAVAYDASNPYSDVDFVADVCDDVKSSPFASLYAAFAKFLEYINKFIELITSIF
ncbi:MAG: hypothetical protein IJZ35_09920 [Clostridia bacterium]|nr:hypothetical protein [Clostridia bacterium]